MPHRLEEALRPDEALVVGGGGVRPAGGAAFGIAAGAGLEHEAAPLHVLVRVRGLEHQLLRRARHRAHRVQYVRVDARDRQLRAATARRCFLCSAYEHIFVQERTSTIFASAERNKFRSNFVSDYMKQIQQQTNTKQIPKHTINPKQWQTVAVSANEVYCTSILSRGVARGGTGEHPPPKPGKFAKDGEQRPRLSQQ